MMTPIKHAANFLNGAAFKPSDWGDEGLPIIRIAQLTGKPFDNFYSGEINRGIHVENGDLLFSWSATIDAFVWKRGSAILNQHIFKVIPKVGADKQFLYYTIKSHAPRWAEDDAHGSTMKHIKKSALSNKVWLPNIEAQRVIADFLDRETTRIDQLIEAKTSLMQVLAERKTAMICDAVTGANGELKANLGEGSFFPSPPKGWKRYPLKFLVCGPNNGTWGGEAGHGETDAICVRVADFDWGNLKVDLRSPTIRSFDKKQVDRLRLQPGDIILEKSGGGDKTPVGRVVQYVDSVNAISSNFVARVRANRNIDHDYLLFLLAAQYMSGFSRKFVKQNTGIQNLDDKALFRSSVWVPCLETQKKIAENLTLELRKFGEVEEKTRQSIENLREYRASLIAEAVTGQIDVTSWKQDAADNSQPTSDFEKRIA